MTTTERKTCEQLVDQELKDRLEQIRKSAGLDPDDEDSEDCYFEPLSIDRVTTYKVCLSFGGPADFFELDWDGEGWIGGRYIYQGWFDGATRKITDEEAEEIAEAFGIYPNLED
tara:strand:+ start:137 stop:478 length:342 start_codon:yes stop_codon:yes gene_type:complete